MPKEILILILIENLKKIAHAVIINLLGDIFEFNFIILLDKLINFFIFIQFTICAKLFSN